MKHIKSYENINISKENIPKYMVVSVSDDRLLSKLYILNVLGIIKDVDDDDDDELKVIKLYTYENDKLEKNVNQFAFNIRFKNNILKNVYHSNDLGDCMNMVKVMLNSNKYNL